MLHPRLFLITPAKFELDSFKKVLENALSCGDVASLLISEECLGNSCSFDESVKVIESIASTAQKFGVSVLVQNNMEIVEKTTVDGIHIESGQESLEQVIEKFQPSRIVGAGGVSTRHHAMNLAEKNVDYVFFGHLYSQDIQFADHNSIELAAWWAEIFEIPGIAVAGPKLESINEIAQTGIDFVAVRDAIWNFPEGAGAAIKLATESLKNYRLMS